MILLQIIQQHFMLSSFENINTVWNVLQNNIEASSNPQSHSTSNWRNASCNWIVNHRNRILLCFNALSLIFLAQDINHTKIPMAFAFFIFTYSVGIFATFRKASNDLEINVFTNPFLSPRRTLFMKFYSFVCFANFWFMRNSLQERRS